MSKKDEVVTETTPELTADQLEIVRLKAQLQVAQDERLAERAAAAEKMAQTHGPGVESEFLGVPRRQPIVSTMRDGATKRVDH